MYFNIRLAFILLGEFLNALFKRNSYIKTLMVALKSLTYLKKTCENP